MKRPKRAPVRPTLAHAVMVLAGLATFVLVTAALRDRSQTVDVFVAASPIEAGTPIEGAELGTIALGADSALLSTMVRVDAVDPGLVVARRLQPGEPLLRGDLVPGDAGAALRTVALPVERLVIDGLGLRIGDRVDVIGVGTDGTSRFVAVDVGVSRLPAEAAIGLGRTADTATTWLTVAVSDAQALDLAAASSRGSIVVARSTGAVSVAGTVASSTGSAGAHGGGPIADAERFDLNDDAERPGTTATSRPGDGEGA